MSTNEHGEARGVQPGLPGGEAAIPEGARGARAAHDGGMAGLGSKSEHPASPEDLAVAPPGSGPSSEPPTSPEPAAPADWQARVTRLGRAGVVVYALVQIATIAGFYAALMSPEVRSQPFIAEHMGEGSSLFSAWLLSKALIVPRAAFTCALTPLVARPINAAWARVAGRAG